MGRKTQVAIIAVVVLLLGGAVAAYAYDGSQKDTIANGVTVAGVDLSGMTREQLQHLLPAGAAISGAVCPLCVIVAPALVGYGLYARLKNGREPEQSVAARTAEEE